MAEMEETAAAKAREELAKLRAETLKLEAERRNLQRTYKQARTTAWDRAGELVKTAGAVIALVVAGITAIATPQIIKLQTELARRDKEAAEKQRDAAVADADKASRDLGVLVAQKNDVVRQRDAAKKEFADLQAAIAGLRVSDPASVAAVKRTAERVQPSVAASPFIYIVPSSPQLNDQAVEFAKFLAGFQYQTYVRKATQMQGRAPDRTEVRYFTPNDADEAGRIADAVRRRFGIDVQSSPTKDPDIKQTRYFEIRFARSSN